MIRRSVKAVVRLAVLEAHSYVCYYCGDVACEVDHIMPVKHDGTDAPENLIASCEACNRSKKGNLLPPEALEAALRSAKEAAFLVRSAVPNAPEDVVFYSDWVRKSIALPVRLWGAISKIRRDTSGRIPSEVETVRNLLWEAVSARQNIAEKMRQ